MTLVMSEEQEALDSKVEPVSRDNLVAADLLALPERQGPLGALEQQGKPDHRVLVDRQGSVETLDLLVMLASKDNRVLEDRKVLQDLLDPVVRQEPRDKPEQLVILEQLGKLDQLDRLVSQASPDCRVSRVEQVSLDHREDRANRELLGQLDRREYQPRSENEVRQVTRVP